MKTTKTFIIWTVFVTHKNKVVSARSFNNKKSAEKEFFSLTCEYLELWEYNVSLADSVLDLEQ